MPILYVNVRFSWIFAGLMILFHVVAGLGVYDSSLPFTIQVALILLILMSFIYQSYRCLLFKYVKQITAFGYRGESWHLRFVDQSSAIVKLNTSSYVSKLFTVLRFNDEENKQKYTLILPYDAYLKPQRIELRRLIKLCG